MSVLTMLAADVEIKRREARAHEEAARVVKIEGYIVLTQKSNPVTSDSKTRKSKAELGWETIISKLQSMHNEAGG
ncbi:hypothetical protein EVAR_81806_1 [Eumeta japonica]|uniref:Uncharacterized protein n=1 Tax=Eumeta variegata TaxID=151549 RepID=A0A4C1UHJ1_EUMVA|nr:hypothetical protein EVAR_81806_1 [Eumeta japonica]